MFVNEVNLCLANGLYKVLKKLRHPTLISKSFSAIKKVRDYALEISKTRFESFQQEKNFSLDTNVERALVVFRKKLRQCFSSQKFRQDVNTATRGSSGSPQTMLVDELQMDLKEIDSAIPYSSLHQRTLALQQTLPDIVHSINAKHQIRSDVLKEFRNDTVPRHLSIAQMPPTMVTTRSSTPISLQDDIHFTSSDIAHSKAQDHPLIQMSISRRFKPKCNSSSNQPIARYLSTTSRRISHYTDQPWIHLVETESQNDIKNRVNLTQTTPLSGIGQARFHQKSTQDDIGLNIWDLVHWLMDDDREGGYGPEAGC
ncbi:hypothetical protein HMI56_003909 [Coelomomyces lativittatus]|nr:hypothetical protein HMI56_003909 [Coelomomyces lativittatus]